MTGRSSYILLDVLIGMCKLVKGGMSSLSRCRIQVGLLAPLYLNSVLKVLMTEAVRTDEQMKAVPMLQLEEEIAARLPGNAGSALCTLIL